MGENQDGHRMVGRYKLIEQIGSGGFGETWRAYDEMLDTDVAIKAFRYPDPADHDRYLREARSMARLSGVEGIAHVRDLIEEDERLYLVMDYVEGEDLSQLLAREGRLTQGQMLSILEPVSSALEAMHGRGVVHRDVSPDNIRVTPEGRGTLLDFGSVLSANHVGHTITVKPGYAPPEQYGEASTQGPWTDVYALAACAYQCLCGMPPIDSLQRIFHDEIKRPSELGVTLAPGVEDALMAGLSLDGRARTQAVRTLMEGLRGHAPVATFASAAPRTLVNEVPRTIVSESPGAFAGQRPEVSANEVPPTVADERPEVLATDEPKVDLGAQAPKPSGNGPEATLPGEKTRQGWPTEVVPAAVTKAVQPGSGAGEAKTGAVSQEHAGWKERLTKVGGLAKPKLEPKKLLVLLGVMAAVVLAVVLGTVLFGRVGSTDYPASESITRETISAETASRLANDPEKKSVTFTACVVPDEALEMLATSETIESITLNACTGFSSLAALDDMSSLVSLNLSTMEGVDLDALFPRTMHTLQLLRLQTMSIEGGTDALGRFPSLTTLVLSPVEGIDDIGFLDSLPKLEQLDLSGIDLSGGKVKKLATLEKLEVARVNLCNMSTLDWTTSCPELTTLEAQGNQIHDLSPLAGHEELRTLWLSDNEIYELEPLYECPALADVLLAQNQVQSVEGLGGHEQMWRLSLANNYLSNIEGLYEMRALVQLSLEHNQLNSIEPIAQSTGLKRLDVSDNQLDEIDVCERFIGLEQLDASHNSLSDISKLASCSQLKLLLLQDNQISSIEALGNDFLDLETLNIAYNEVSSLEPLSACSKLKYVVASNNAITSLDGLQDKPKLDTLLADHNQIGSIEALGTSTGVLQNVDLGYNSVSSIAALSGMLSQDPYGLYASLLLDHNQIRTLEGLPVGKSYNGLALHGNPISDFSGLSSAQTKWSVLYLPYVENTSYSFLGELPLIGSTRLVGVPYDRQNKLLRDLGIAESDRFSARPQFISDQEAEEEMESFRQQLQSKVSGMPGSQGTQNAKDETESSEEREEQSSNVSEQADVGE